jgi:hypothetical protein
MLIAILSPFYVAKLLINKLYNSKSSLSNHVHAKQWAYLWIIITLLYIFGTIASVKNDPSIIITCVPIIILNISLITALLTAKFTPNEISIDAQQVPYQPKINLPDLDFHIQKIKFNKPSKKTQYIIAGIIAILIITNPSLRSFKEHLGYTESNGLSREYNFLLCSVYQDGNTTYFGICENFINI